MSLSVLVDGERVNLCQRIEIYPGIKQRMVEAALWAVKVSIEAALRDEVTARLGRRKYEWRFLSLLCFYRFFI